MRPKEIAKRLMAATLSAALTVCLLSGISPSAQARNKTLLVEQARNLAYAHSAEITSKNNEIILKRMKYDESVDGIKAKVKNLRSFRWTPLLSFKFPQKLDLVEDYDLNIKPLTLQAEIDTLIHELREIKLAAYQEVNSLFAEIYVLQEKIDFTRKRLNAAQTELERNKARLLTGDATEADVEKMTSSVEALTTELSNLISSFESKKQTLSDKIGLDVTSGYTFRNPLKTLSLPRSQLDWVTQYTLDNDHSYYIAETAASTALLNLNAYEGLMRDQYGDKMNYIQNYVNMVKRGMTIDYAAFKLDYKAMIKALDKPWDGKIRILFFTFTLEWFKGAISGSRYIEDEMYAVYTACMEYANAEKERASAEKELRDSITEQYEALVTQYKAYEQLKSLSDKAGATLEKVLALNKLGKAEYNEVKDARDNYQQMQLETVDALATYNSLLYQFDKTTCGAVTVYMKGEGVSVGSGGTGDSFSTLDPISDPYYYIYTSVQKMKFSIGVSIPDNFQPAIDSFEIWIDGKQVGEKTETGTELSHLALDYQASSEVTIRLFNGDDFVCECVVDASIPRDTLPIERTQLTVQEDPEIGSYEISTTPIGGLSTSVLTLKLDEDVEAETYTISYGEHGTVYSSEPVKTSEPLTYLTMLVVSLEDTTLNLCDGAGGLLYTAHFDTSKQKIIKDITQE